MVERHAESLLGAFVVVFMMMAILFRSLRFGLMAMLPLTITILAVYGLIGWIGKDYDMPIAVLSSLTLGLSVDFAIHFIERMRALYAETGSFADAGQRMFEEPARAISRNAIVIALGFTPLFFAPLVPYITVGAFMASIMAISGARHPDAAARRHDAGHSSPRATPSRNRQESSDMQCLSTAA